MDTRWLLATNWLDFICGSLPMHFGVAQLTNATADSIVRVALHRAHASQIRLSHCIYSGLPDSPEHHR